MGFTGGNVIVTRSIDMQIFMESWTNCSFYKTKRLVRVASHLEVSTPYMDWGENSPIAGKETKEPQEMRDHNHQKANGDRSDYKRLQTSTVLLR